MPLSAKQKQGRQDLDSILKAAVGELEDRHKGNKKEKPTYLIYSINHHLRTGVHVEQKGVCKLRGGKRKRRKGKTAV